MIIIELPNGTKVHADGVDIAPDGHIYAYEQTEEPEVDEELTWGELEPDLQQAIVDRLAPQFKEQLEKATPQTFAAGKLKGTMRGSVDVRARVDSLSEKQYELYKWFKDNGPISVKNLSEISGLPKGSITTRMIPLRERGLLVTAPAKGEWMVVA